MGSGGARVGSGGLRAGFLGVFMSQDEKRWREAERERIVIVDARPRTHRHIIQHVLHVYHLEREHGHIDECPDPSGELDAAA